MTERAEEDLLKQLIERHKKFAPSDEEARAASERLSEYIKEKGQSITEEEWEEIIDPFKD